MHDIATTVAAAAATAFLFVGAVYVSACDELGDAVAVLVKESLGQSPDDVPPGLRAHVRTALETMLMASLAAAVVAGVAAAIAYAITTPTIACLAGGAIGAVVVGLSWDRHVRLSALRHSTRMRR